MSAKAQAAPVAPRAVKVASFSAKLSVSNATEKKTNAFMVWKSQGNKFFETFSYLPALSDADILKQVQYLLKNNWTPCVEFEFPANSTCAPAYASGVDSSASACYYTNRYWSMWKLPMYGATDADSVLAECKKAAKAFPNAFVRLAGFDANKQVQVVSFIVHRPAGGEALAPAARSVQG